MQRNRGRLAGLFTLAASAAVALLATAPMTAGNAKSSTKALYAFCKSQDCIDGAQPEGNLFMDINGNLFGMTTGGGLHGGGTVYEIIRKAETGSHRHKVIYHFCLLLSCEDGTSPQQGALIADVEGTLYGTASAGGTTGNGVVFKLVPNARQSRWTYSVIYNFCQDFSGCEDGANPVGGLTYAGAETGVSYDGISPLYGTTSAGGRHHVGAVFSLTPKNGLWIEKVPYFFCSGGSDCSDGAVPNGGLIMDKNGALNGTTSDGGIDNAGVVYRLTPTGNPRWSETVLHQFCSQNGCADGSEPRAGVVSDASGNLFGTTSIGGNANNACGGSGCGVVFKIDSHGLWSQPYAFCSETDCADGGLPTGLALDSFGSVVGLAAVGGKNGFGTIFSLIGSDFAVTTDLKCKSSPCPLGSAPRGDLLIDTTGNIFGTMSAGGNSGGGTIFEHTPPAE